MRATIHAVATGFAVSLMILLLAELSFVLPRSVAEAKPNVRSHLSPHYWGDRRYLRAEFRDLEHVPKPAFVLRKLSKAERAAIERARQRTQ